MAKLYNPILSSVKPTLSQDSLNAWEKYQTRDNSNLESDVQNVVKPVLTQQKFSKGNAPKTNFQAILPEYNTSLSGTGRAYAKILPDTKKKEIATGTQRFFEQAPSQAGFMQGFSLNNPKNTLEKKLGQTIDTTAAEQQTAYKIGEGLGIASQFAIPYAGASGVIGKGVTKLLPNAGKFAPILKSVATDIAVGLPLNANFAFNKQGLQGNEALKSIAQNTAIDLVTGGVLEAIGGIVLKSGKKVASKADFEALTPQEQQEARLMLTGPVNQPQKLLTEGQNWGEPVKPNFYVNQGGIVSGDMRAVNTPLLNAPVEGYSTQLPRLSREVPRTITLNELSKESAQPILKQPAIHTQIKNTVPQPQKTNLDNVIPSKRAAAKNYSLQEINKKIQDKYMDLSFAETSDARRRIEADIKNLESQMELLQTSGSIPSPTPTATVQPQNPEKGINIPKKQMFAENADLQKPILKDLGADTIRINETTRQNIDQFGAFKGGNIPKATAFGDTQKHANTLYNSSLADENLKERIAEAVNEGDFTKYTKHNATALKNADYEMKRGVESARTKFDSVSTSEKIPTSDDLALGYKLMKEYQEAGRYDDALTVAEDLSQMLSETGRTLQAARMANLLTPDGRIRMLGKSVNRMKKTSGQDIKLSNETLAAVKNAKSEKEIAEANKKAFVEIWNQIPVRWTEKLNAWRYMSMLFNPKTHIRNMVGNLIFVPVRTLKNTIGTGLESKIIKNGGEKTKAILTAKDRDLIDFAKSDYPNVEGILKNETKFSDTLRDHDAKVFNTAILEKIRTLNGGALDKEDLFFLSKAYSSSMAQYMKANGLKAADMQGVKLDRARHYAMNEAAKATYRDTSEFATKLNQTKRDLARSDNGFKKALGIMLEGTVPFTKTPVNILKRGVEYSPVGLLNGAVKLRKALAKGENPVDAIDKLAAGLSGTGILALGAWFNHMGVLQGANDDPYGTKKNAYETMQGEQEYSLNFGDKSYTVDWAAPVSMPLFVGAELYKALSSGGVGFSEITDGILSIAEPMLNLSMLQGINEAVKTGFNDNAMFSVAETTLSGYASQFVPTVGGQISRSIDPVRRSTASTAESTTQRQLERFKNKQIAKIPFVSKTLEPSIDLWGREQKNGNVLEQFLSPGYFKKENVTPVDQEINRLSDTLGPEDVTKIIPRKTGQYDVVKDKVPYRMTEKELTQFQQIRGQESYNGLTALFGSQQYSQMSDADKVKAISKIYDQAFETAKAQMLSGRNVKY